MLVINTIIFIDNNNYEIITILCYSLFRLFFNNSTLHKLFSVIVFFSWVTSTKMYESDLLAYQNLLIDSSESSLFDFLGSSITIYTNFIFYTFFWFFSKTLPSISFVSASLFYISYLFILKSSRVFFKDNSQFILVSLLFIFYYSLFDMSAHLIRQFVASSILLYGLTSKNNIFIISSPLIHTSSFFALSNYLKNLKILFSILILVFFLAQIGTVNQVFVQLYAKTDNLIEFNELRVFDFIILIFCLFSLFDFKFRSYFLFPLISIFALIIIFIENTEITLRIFQYIHFFLPIAIVISINNITNFLKLKSIKNLTYFLIFTIFTIHFAYRLILSPTWNYFYN